jgi:hypothetical protein
MLEKRYRGAGPGKAYRNVLNRDMSPVPLAKRNKINQKISRQHIKYH